jgi:hypothetical protein
MLGLGHHGKDRNTPGSMPLRARGSLQRPGQQWSQETSSLLLCMLQGCEPCENHPLCQCERDRVRAFAALHGRAVAVVSTSTRGASSVHGGCASCPAFVRSWCSAFCCGLGVRRTVTSRTERHRHAVCTPTTRFHMRSAGAAIDLLMPEREKPCRDLLSLVYGFASLVFERNDQE